MQPPCIVIVAGETSGDNLAAGLIKALHARKPHWRFAGIAGPAMVSAGCEAWAAAEELAVMGLFDVLRHLPRLLRLRRAVLARVRQERPLAFVGVDAPEFNLGLAARLVGTSFPVIQYVSPQVWAWRSGRVRKMAKTLQLVLCLLPFEKKFYDGHGLAADFVGHPLADRLPLVADRAAARHALAVPLEGEWIALLPGSRVAEVSRLADDFLAAAERLTVLRPDVRFMAPMANGSARQVFEAALARRPGIAAKVTLFDGRSSEVLTASNCVLVASGTATLETLLCKRPMVVAYKLGRATAWLARRLQLMKAPFFSQPNLLAGRAVVCELLQEAVTPQRLADEVVAWLDAPERVEALQMEFSAIHQRLRQGASERAADAVIRLIETSSADARPS